MKKYRIGCPWKTMVPDIKRILYATDLSDTARHAVRYACSIGHKYGAKVTLLHVIPDIVEEISIGTEINLIDHMGKGISNPLLKKIIVERKKNGKMCEPPG